MKIRGYLGDRKILTIVLLISFTLFGLVPMTAINGNPLNIGKSTVNLLNAQDDVYTSTQVTVNVLIYDGEGVIPGSVEGIKDCLDYANDDNWRKNHVRLVRWPRNRGRRLTREQGRPAGTLSPGYRLVRAAGRSACMYCKGSACPNLYTKFCPSNNPN